MNSFFLDDNKFSSLYLYDNNEANFDVDFTNHQFHGEKKKKLYNGYDTKYDIQTLEHYRVCRKLKVCPITCNEINTEFAFEYPYQWDPYTGEVKGKDPNGSLYFDPDTLIKYFYFNRLNKLWVDSKDEGSNGGYYEGIYDDGVGAGEDFYIASRGYHPEWYLFRLPIIDCYLTEDHNTQVVTFGPKLTNEQIRQIEEKAKLKGNSYYKMYKSYRPSIIKMKELYDDAISKIPNLSIDISSLSSSEIQEQRNKANRIAVDKLKTMKG